MYSLVHQTMTQPLVKDYVPLSWASMVKVKTEYFRALSHYHAAFALCGGHAGETHRRHVRVFTPTSPSSVSTSAVLCPVCV